MNPDYNQTNAYDFLPQQTTPNPYDNRQLQWLKRVLTLLYVIVIAFVAWQLTHAIETAKHTGTLDITTTAANSQISITQDDRAAAFVGSGSADLRLQAGTYQVAAFANGVTKIAVVTVSANHTSTTHLNMSSNVSQQVRTVEDVNFEGIGNLISTGLSSEQVSEMEQYFFQFDSSERTVTIDINSIEPGPRNPNVISPFSLNFNVTVDSTAYRASVAYYDTNDITLTLYNSQTNAQVFTAGSIQPPTGQ